jgi:hypothetical protein
MTTIYAINADGQERYDSVHPDRVAKRIKELRRQGWLNVRVIPTLKE